MFLEVIKNNILMASIEYQYLLNNSTGFYMNK